MKTILPAAFFILFFSWNIKGQTDKKGSLNVINAAPCINEGFEQTAPGAYTVPNSVAGWSVSGGTNPGGCAASVYTAGSSEFSIVATPVLNVPYLGSLAHSPLGGTVVACLNNSVANAYSTRLTQSFPVTSNNTLFEFAYAGYFQSSSHPCCDNAEFKVLVRTCNGSLISCLSYSLAPAPLQCTGGNNYTLYNNAYITDWKVASIDLTALTGTCAIIEVITSDCSQGDHAASIYFDSRCGVASASVCSECPVTSTVNPVSFCAGSNSAVIQAPPGYTSYSWTAPFNVPITPSQATLSVLSLTNAIPGTVFTLNLTGSSLCNYVATYTLAFTQTGITATGNSPSCSNGASGSATVMASGSGSGYNYSWTNSTSSVVGTASVVNNLAPGVYTVTAISPESSCGAAQATVSIGNTASTFSTFLVQYCGTGVILTPGSGSGFQWYAGTTMITGTVGNLSSYTVVAPVNYAVYSTTFITLQGCKDSIKYIISQVPAGMMSVAANTVCSGVNNGEAIITISPGPFSPTGYNYFIVNSTGTNTPVYSSSVNPTSMNSYTASGLMGGGTYSVSASDGLCNYALAFTVSALSPQFDFTVTTQASTLCLPQSANAGLSFSQAPSPGEYTYSWTPSQFLAAGNNTMSNIAITPTLQPFSTITIIYTVVVTPTNATCPLSKTLAISAAYLLNPTVTPIFPVCQNEPSFSVTVNPAGGSFVNASSAFIDVVSGLITPSLAPTGISSFDYQYSALGCVVATPVSFIVNPKPVLTLAGDFNICEGDEVKITASGAHQYTWSQFGNNNVFSGVPVITATYSVKGTETVNTCSDEKVFTVELMVCTELTDLKDINSIRIFPNPGSGIFKIEGELKGSYRLYDILGTTISPEHVLVNKKYIDLSAFPDGIYFIEIRQGNRSEVHKLIKTH